MNKRTALLIVAMMVCALGALLNFLVFEITTAAVFLVFGVFIGWLLWLRMEKGRR